MRDRHGRRDTHGAHYVKNHSMNVVDLPSEILADILSECDTRVASETCKTFASVVHSMSWLWTSVRIHPHQYTLSGPQLLGARLSRAKCAPLDVTISCVLENTVGVSALCKVLAEYNAQIRHFELTAQDAMVAGAVVQYVFPGTAEAYPALEVLSVLSKREGDSEEYELPRLDKVLSHAATQFPNVRKLHINSFYDSVPVPPLSSTPFTVLTTLILDGALEDDIPTPGLLAALLNGTPGLETLWIKHHFWENFDDVSQPTAYGSYKGRSNVSLDIQLPRLKHLAVSVPGTACELMGCITAPALEDLHLDGSRGPHWSETERPEFEWDDWATGSVQRALKLFAARSKSVRRFAVTRAYLTQTGWEWVLFGEEGGRWPPFPQLECIALHGMFEYANDLWSGFDDELLEKFASSPRIPLRRLVLMYCEFPLHAPSVVGAFRASKAEGQKELECDDYVPLWEEDGEDWAELEELGVSVLCKEGTEVVEDLWWVAGHGIDGTDSSRY